MSVRSKSFARLKIEVVNGILIHILHYKSQSHINIMWNTMEDVTLIWSTVKQFIMYRQGSTNLRLFEQLRL